MADPLIASAFVKIKPEPTSVSGFGKDVRGKIEKSFTRPIKIKVEPTLLPFKARLQKELSTPVFTIKVSPVLAPGFKSTVQKLARAAVADVSVPIRTVTPVGAVGRAAAAAKPTATGPATSTAAARELKFQSELKRLADQRTLAQQKLTSALQTGGTAQARLSALAKPARAAEVALNAALKSQITLEGSLTVKQAARLATIVKRAQAQVAAVAAEKAAIQVTIDKAAADKLADNSADLRASIETRLAGVLGARAEIEQAGALVTGRVAKARAELTATTAVQTSAEKLATDAAAIHAEVMTVESAALKRLTADLALEAAAATKAAKANVSLAISNEEAAVTARAHAAAQAQLSKGLLATALAAAGARGATLAASSEFLIGAAAATALFKSVQLAARLEEELHVFQETANATAIEMERVSAAAKRLGADVTLPSVSANEAAEAMTELAKAGLTVQNSIDAARGTLQLGTAAQLDNATAVNITASALNAFGLAGTQAVHVADLLAGAANAAQGGIGDMGASLSSVASVARQAGINIEDTVALLTLLAKNGIQGSEAGTALRVAILRLIAPTKKAADQLTELGVSVLDTQGNMRPEVFNDIAVAVNELGPAQRNMALQTIFGTRAIRAQAVIGREGTVGLNNMRDATNQQGAAARLAAARTAGFTGDVEALKNASASLGLAIGEILIPSLSKTVTQLGEITTGAFEAIEGLRELKAALPGAEDVGGSGITDFFSPGFDPGLISTGIGGIAARIKEVRASIDLVRQGNLGRAIRDGLEGDFRLPSEQVEAFSAEVEKLTGNVDELAIKLSEARQEADTFDVSKLVTEVSDGGRGRTPIEPRVFVGPVDAQVKFLRDLRKEIVGTGEEADEARARIDALLRLTVALGRSPTALEIKVLFERGGLTKEFVETQRIINQTKLNIGLGLDKKSKVFFGNDVEDVMRVEGQQAETVFKTAFGDAMAADPLGRAVWDPFFLLAQEAAESAGEKAASAFSTKFSTFLAAQEASGASDAERLADLRGLVPGAERRFRRAQARQRAAPTKEHEAFLEFAAQRLNEINSEIDSILSDQETAAKAGADKIAKAKNEADQKFLDAMGLTTGRAENAVLRAEGTARLTDDIKTHTFLRDLLVRQRDEAIKTLKDAQLRAETVQSLTADIIRENQEIADLNKELISSLSEQFEAKIDIATITGTVNSLRKIYATWINALQKALAQATKGSKLARDLKAEILQTQKAAFDAINEGFELDIQIAEAQERPRAEIKARERFIEQLKRERDLFKKGTLEYKRLTLAIIEQEQAIKEATGELDKTNKANEEMQFKFLQTQSGFAANLLGNLIPGGLAMGGLVGGTTTPGSASAAAAAAAAASTNPFGPPLGTGRGPDGGPVIPRRPGDSVGAASVKVPSGPTLTGQTREIQLLNQILTVLHQIKNGNSHPEAKQTRRASSSGGGSGADML